MEPMSEFKDQLFYGNNSDRIVQFSCGHIIPSDNILPLIICSGPSGKQLDFSYESRTSIKMVLLLIIFCILYYNDINLLYMIVK